MSCLYCTERLVDVLSVTVRLYVLTALVNEVSVLVRLYVLTALVKEVSVLVRLVVLTALSEARFESWCQQALKSLVNTIDGLVLEPKGGYVQYDHNNHIYYYEVLHGGDIEDQGSVENQVASGGWTWRTGLSGIARGPQTFGRVRR